MVHDSKALTQPDLQCRATHQISTGQAALMEGFMNHSVYARWCNKSLSLTQTLT